VKGTLWCYASKLPPPKMDIPVFWKDTKEGSCRMPTLNKIEAWTPSFTQDPVMCCGEQVA
jgi:hypothetical protein